MADAREARVDPAKARLTVEWGGSQFATRIQRIKPTRPRVPPGEERPLTKQTV